MSVYNPTLQTSGEDASLLIQNKLQHDRVDDGDLELFPPRGFRTTLTRGAMELQSCGDEREIFLQRNRRRRGTSQSYPTSHLPSFAGWWFRLGSEDFFLLGS
jgi:hypothetical protein